MVNVRELDPNASPLAFFGCEVRRLREIHDMTLDQLGAKVYVSGSLIGQIETATKVPKYDLIPRIDTALEARRGLVRLWNMAIRTRLPKWFQETAELEAKAERIHTYQAQLVHGLLQTPGYAEAVLGVMSDSGLDEKVAARLSRQSILDREDPPVLWVVMDEAVLHREVGGPATMRTQLLRLLSWRDTDEVQIQILPNSAGAHPGVLGSFTLYSFAEQADIAYQPGYEDGWATANPQETKARWLRYDLVRAAALSPGQSAELITRVLEEQYGHHPDDHD
ncbi:MULTISPECIES: helix-turn-helix transcriptional regulator [unclassified Streptomyces]|uniref:helix-turn-helix domain-containing protein n=1 Tax=unclassified Streptomyces TaxID=2593676 RepID=UPI00278C8708|nr:MULTISPECIES: helix-turn-helix transcriptional regulator [unclassified Streptomyces]